MRQGQRGQRRSLGSMAARGHLPRDPPPRSSCTLVFHCGLALPSLTSFRLHSLCH